jgi:hypothetical protein
MIANSFFEQRRKEDLRTKANQIAERAVVRAECLSLLKKGVIREKPIG